MTILKHYAIVHLQVVPILFYCEKLYSPSFQLFPLNKFIIIHLTIAVTGQKRYLCNTEIGKSNSISMTYCRYIKLRYYYYNTIVILFKYSCCRLINAFWPAVGTRHSRLQWCRVVPIAEVVCAETIAEKERQYYNNKIENNREYAITPEGPGCHWDCGFRCCFFFLNFIS